MNPHMDTNPQEVTKKRKFFAFFTSLKIQRKSIFKRYFK